MQAITLTLAQARKIILDAAGLASPAQFGYGIEAVNKVIQHLGFVQLDTNYVVERAHHHVLYTRVPDYEIGWLSALCEEGNVFEYFSSDAGYLPMEDFRFSLPIKQAFKTQRKEISKPEILLMEQIMDQVERDGAVRVGDFENDRVEASTGWWDWRPAKVALERLYFDGRLMISRDSKFHKRYDVPLNLVPLDTDMTLPTNIEFARFIIKRTLGALGIATVKEMAWRARRIKGNLVKTELQKMVEEGAVLKVQIEALKGPHYMLREQKTDVQISNEVFILSPFDILNVFRHRLREFFDFDYQIECFVPAAKRKYGYFSLPILAGDTFIARMDAKADRKKKMLMVHNIHFEEVPINKQLIEKFSTALKAFATFNQCYDIRFAKSNRADDLERLQNTF
ncbi:winged helix-turn-helix domain-containing protein [Pedobacter yonginense]|uniref:Winged helix-turn-helix domain-containing protein n=1 Tax=Pedobacter yonginense TaxID=651869 RepID=A0A317EUT9_9SPHI|nr:crosslink repair DNA glycosylase YcaQ family protein [Pedobacter yonginense]PWS29599.1 winged helix-turn-helix domain-containing protein [Pedobacter yonginense]